MSESGTVVGHAGLNSLMRRRHAAAPILLARPSVPSLKRPSRKQLFHRRRAVCGGSQGFAWRMPRVSLYLPRILSRPDQARFQASLSSRQRSTANEATPAIVRVVIAALQTLRCNPTPALSQRVSFCNFSRNLHLGQSQSASRGASACDDRAHVVRIQLG